MPIEHLQTTVTDHKDGTTYDLLGDSLSEIAQQAKQLTDNGADLSRAVVRKDNNELVGWVNGDGTWQYA